MNTPITTPKNSFLDILFEGRNKAYGAYELRTNYASRLKLSLAIVGSITAFLFGYSLYASNKPSDVLPPEITTEVNLQNAPKKEEPVIIPPIIEQPQPQPQATNTIATERYNIPKIVADKDFVEEDRPPEISDLNQKKIANFKSEGTDDNGIVAPPSELKEEGTGTDINTFKKEEDVDHGIAITVNIEAQYPGGPEEWRRFLIRNLDYPESATEAQIQGDIWVQFIVDKDGNVSEIEALNDLGGGLAQEAIRIIKRSKKWKPAEYNGKKVTYRQKQKITFKLF